MGLPQCSLSDGDGRAPYGMSDVPLGHRALPVVMKGTSLFFGCDDGAFLFIFHASHLFSFLPIHFTSAKCVMLDGELGLATRSRAEMSFTRSLERGSHDSIQGLGSASG